MPEGRADDRRAGCERLERDHPEPLVRDGRQHEQVRGPVPVVQLCLRDVAREAEAAGEPEVAPPAVSAKPTAPVSTATSVPPKTAPTTTTKKKPNDDDLMSGRR